MSAIATGQTADELRGAVARMTNVMRATLLEVALEGCILLDAASREEIDVIVTRAVERVPAAGLCKPAPLPASPTLCRDAAAGPWALHLVTGGGHLPQAGDTYVDDPSRGFTADELGERMRLLEPEELSRARIAQGPPPERGHDDDPGATEPPLWGARR